MVWCALLSVRVKYILIENCGVVEYLIESSFKQQELNLNNHYFLCFCLVFGPCATSILNVFYFQFQVAKKSVLSTKNYLFWCTQGFRPFIIRVASKKFGLRAFLFSKYIKSLGVKICQIRLLLKFSRFCVWKSFIKNPQIIFLVA